jgi:hypothetical protein
LGVRPKVKLGSIPSDWRKALPEGAKHQLRWFESQRTGAKVVGTRILLNALYILATSHRRRCEQGVARGSQSLHRQRTAPTLCFRVRRDECNTRDSRSKKEKANGRSSLFLLLRLFFSATRASANNLAGKSGCVSGCSFWFNKLGEEAVNRLLNCS